MITPEGIQIVRGLMLREAMDKATDGAYFINPHGFADELAKMQKHWGVVFNKEQQEILEGFSTLTDLAYRANKRASDMGAVGGMVGGFGAIGGVGFALSQATGGTGEEPNMLPYLATVFGARMLLTTKGGTNLIKMAAHVDDFATKEGQQVLHVANLLMTRYLSQNYPEIHKELTGKFPAGPELKQAVAGMYDHPVL